MDQDVIEGIDQEELKRQAKNKERVKQCKALKALHRDNPSSRDNFTKVKSLHEVGEAQFFDSHEVRRRRATRREFESKFES